MVELLIGGAVFCRFNLQLELNSNIWLISYVPDIRKINSICMYVYTYVATYIFSMILSCWVNLFRWKLLHAFHGGDLASVTIVIQAHWLAVTLLLIHGPFPVNMAVKAQLEYLSFALNTVLRMIGHIWKVM